MSAELYQRQMNWRQFISRRTEEQGQAILEDACGRGATGHQDSLVKFGGQQRHPSSRTPPTAGSRALLASPPSLSRSKTMGRTVDKTQPTTLAVEGGAREQRQGRRRQQQRHYQESSHKPAPVPSYSSMLAARRSRVGLEVSPAGVATQSLRSRFGSCSPTRGRATDTTAVRSTGVEGSSHRMTARSRASSLTRGRRVARQSVGGNTGVFRTRAAAAAGLIHPKLSPKVAVTSETAMAQKPPLQAAAKSASLFVVDPVSADSERRRNGSDTTPASATPAAAPATAALGLKTSAGRRSGQRSRKGRQNGEPLPSSERVVPGSGLQGRDNRSSGVSVVSAAACTSTAAVVGDVGRNSTRGDDGGATGGRRAAMAALSSVESTAPFAEASLVVHVAELERKEQIWMRERAQLLTLIKLQHKQLMHPCEANDFSSSPSSCQNGTPLSKRCGAATTTATTALTEPASPRSGSCGATSPPLMPPPPPPPLTEGCSPQMSPIEKDLCGPMMAGGGSGGGCAIRIDTWSPPDSSSMGDDGIRRHNNDQGFVFSTSERTHLLCKVELQREEAARVSRRGGESREGVGIERRSDGVEGNVAVGGGPSARTATSSPTAVAGVSPERLPASRIGAERGESRSSSRSSRSSSCGGSGSGCGKGDPTEVLSCASSGCCAGGRLEARNVEFLEEAIVSLNTVRPVYVQQSHSSASWWSKQGEKSRTITTNVSTDCGPISRYRCKSSLPSQYIAVLLLRQSMDPPHAE